MKKVIVALMAFVALAFGEGFIIGGELGYGNSGIEASAGGVTATADTKYTSVAVRAGYELENIRLMGYINSDKYKDDILIVGEGSAVSYGVELDYIIDVSDTTGLYVGVLYGQGEKDFNIVDIDFTDTGLRVGGLMDLSNDMQLEAGVQYKKRDYDDYSGISMEDDMIGVYIGFNFML